MSICKAFSVSTMQIHCLQIGISSITVTCASFIAGWVHFYCLLFGGQFILIGANTTIRVKYQLDEGENIEDYTFKCDGIAIEPVK